MKNIIMLFLFIPATFFMSCKKETDENPQSEEETKSFILKLKNKIYSEHTIVLFETRFGINYMDTGEQDWSKNHLELANFIQPNDSIFLQFKDMKGNYCEYRLGVISNQGAIVNLDEQEGYDQYFYPHFTWSNNDTVELALSILANNTGYIYIRDY